MGIKTYFRKFYENVERLEKKSPSGLALCRYALGGIADYIIYGSTITDYFELTFHRKTHAQKKAMVTWRFHKKFIYSVDDPREIERLAKKDAMYRSLESYIQRRQLETDKCSREEFAEYFRSVPKFLYKPSDGSCGGGIEMIESAKADPGAYYDKWKDVPGVLDECIVQHEDMQRLNPSSVNTLRVFTFRAGNTIYYTGAALRMGTESFIDNYSAGGLVLSVDLKTGKAREAAENYIGDRFSVHPVSKTQLEGFAVPLWDKVLELIFDMASTYDLNYVAWDVAIQKEDVALIEANPAGMINVIQIAGADAKKETYKTLYKRWQESQSGKNNRKAEEKIVFARVLL